MVARLVSGIGLGCSIAGTTTTCVYMIVRTASWVFHSQQGGDHA
jgi:hypothetical protein